MREAHIIAAGCIICPVRANIIEKSTCGCKCFFHGGGWWIRTTEAKVQQIYSLSPLATREIPLELMAGLEPATC